MDILSYFGTYTPAADGAIASFKFEYLITLGIAAIVIFVGRAIVSRSKILRKYAIPAPVVAGLIFSLLISAVKASGTIALSFDTKTMQDLCQNLFFLCVGFGFSFKMIKKAGGKLCIMIAVAACLLITGQDILGVLVGKLIGLHPLLGLGLGSLSLMGGVGTSGAIAPLYEQMGAANATVISVMGATFGMIFASLIGGPASRFLIRKYRLTANKNEVDMSKSGENEIVPLNAKSMMGSVCLVVISAGLGSYIAILAGKIPAIEFPYFVGCMLGGVIIRNILDHTTYEINEAEVDTINSVTLDLFIAMTMMTIDVTKLASVAGAFIIILAAQIILMFLWVWLATFMLCGRDYNAAVMAAAHVGIGLGSGPNAMANMRAVIAEYGPANVAWIVFTPFALIVLDIFNPIFCTVAAPFVAML